MANDRAFQLLEQTSFVARDEVALHPEDMAELEWVDYIFVNVFASDGEPVKCLLLSSPDVPKGCAKLSKRSKGKLPPSASTVRIQPPPFQRVNRGIPTVDELHRHTVKACPRLVETYSPYVELINPEHGFRVDLVLEANETAKANTVYIDRYTLLLLGVPPEDANGRLVIVPRPIPDRSGWLTDVRRNMSAFFSFLGRTFVGQRELRLRVGYLYPFDEHHLLARVHPNTRKFLGVEENDKIVISYNGKEVALPVLDVDTDHIDQVVKIENEFIDSHLFVGIPAISRKELGIPHIGTTVAVRRSLKFLLYKHVNKLILPLLALWFTIVQLFSEYDLGIMVIILITLVLVPLIVYASLSEERAKIK